MAQTGTRRKKALLLISDGNDQNSSTGVDEVRRQIRESEVLVYAIGIDASGASPSSYSSRTVIRRTGRHAAVESAAVGVPGRAANSAADSDDRRIPRRQALAIAAHRRKAV